MTSWISLQWRPLSYSLKRCFHLLYWTSSRLNSHTLLSTLTTSRTISMIINRDKETKCLSLKCRAMDFALDKTPLMKIKNKIAIKEILWTDQSEMCANLLLSILIAKWSASLLSSLLTFLDSNWTLKISKER